MNYIKNILKPEKNMAQSPDELLDRFRAGDPKSVKKMVENDNFIQNGINAEMFHTRARAHTHTHTHTHIQTPTHRYI